MDLALRGDASVELLNQLDVKTYEEAKRFHSNAIWNQLEKITVHEAAQMWLTTLSDKTRKNYQSGLKRLSELGLLDPMISLQAFALVNHEAIIDQIKLVSSWTECSKQSRAACYISFTGFLCRRSKGIIPKALVNREGHAKTFFKVYDKVKTVAMSQSQWLLFLEELSKVSRREALIAKVILQGGKRVSEVLSLHTSQIHWDRRKIDFIQSKMKGKKKYTTITYPKSVMEELKSYIKNREGLVFITRTGKAVMPNRIATLFLKVGKKAGIPFKVTPHVLRASTVTYLKQKGFQDSDIMKVTGHSSSIMVSAYDKTSQESNATERVQLVY